MRGPSLRNGGICPGERIFRDFGWRGGVHRKCGNARCSPKGGNYDLFADITSNRPRMSLSTDLQKAEGTPCGLDIAIHTYWRMTTTASCAIFPDQIPSLQGASPERVIISEAFQDTPSVSTYRLHGDTAACGEGRHKGFALRPDISKIERLRLPAALTADILKGI